MATQSVAGTEAARRLDGKVAVVTGAGRGIGRACGIALAQAGAEVHLIARTASDLDALAGKIESAGGKATVIVGDVCDPEIAASVERMDRVDVLVNNAGFNIAQPFLEVTEEALDAIMGLNFRAAVLIARSAARRMVAGGRDGSIVHIGSAFSHVSGTERSIYSASKFAIEGLTKGMALDLAPHGIRVNTVCPTWTATPTALKGLQNPEVKAFALARIPLGRVGKPEEVAAAVLFLASPAAGMITGTSLRVDGGWTIQ